MKTYENQQTKSHGLLNLKNKIYENEYVTVFKNEKGYVRVSQRYGGVVVIPRYHSTYALIVHSRDKGESIEFPRGFIECGEDHISGGERELKEELNLSSVESYIIGDLHTDTGLLIDNVKAIVCEINNPSDIILQDSEGVLSCDFYKLEDILVLIKNGKIKDNFTLSALMLLYANAIEL